MLDVTVIILTYNEELHISRCLDNVCSFAKKVYVIDSPSTDRTVEICNKYSNVEVVVHKYPGNQAAQFNWALDNIEIDTEWILRLDADEYLLPALIDELSIRLPLVPDDVTGIEFKRRNIFLGKWVKRGIYPVIIMRMFRNGFGRYDARLMDEHILLNEGKSIVLENDFCDHSLINISDYCRKHINYAEREACEVLSEVYGLSSHCQHSSNLGNQASVKHQKKGMYNKLPLFWRSFAYFLYRFFFKGAFLDGKEGFLFAFIQGWWYRSLVDAKILECMNACNIVKNRKELEQAEKDILKAYIKENWNISL